MLTLVWLLILLNGCEARPWSLSRLSEPSCAQDSNDLSIKPGAQEPKPPEDLKHIEAWTHSPNQYEVREETQTQIPSKLLRRCSAAGQSAASTVPAERSAKIMSNLRICDYRVSRVFRQADVSILSIMGVHDTWHWLLQDVGKVSHG